jgi:hypothetical protein
MFVHETEVLKFNEIVTVHKYGEIGMRELVNCGGRSKNNFGLAILLCC